MLKNTFVFTVIQKSENLSYSLDVINITIEIY